MALIDDLTTRLTAYRAAELRALDAQSYGIAGRSKQMADLKTIRDEINILETRIARLGGTSITAVQADFIPNTSGSNNDL